MNRRELIENGAKLALGVAVSNRVLGTHTTNAFAQSSDKPSTTKSFPAKFLWGAATADGVGTENDARRVEYIQRALAGLKRCLDDGVDVRGYIHWSLLDNFEWISASVRSSG
jgi:glycosyl hydrolase family 1